MKYPKDRFDDFPRSLHRRGAHRSPRTRMSKLGSWLIALVSIVVLVACGVGVMWMIDRQVQFTESIAGPGGENAPAESTTQAPTATPTPTPTPTGPEPTVNGDIAITVLNGEGTPGLATAVGQNLIQTGFYIWTTGDAASYDYETTIVAVGTEEELGLALGAVESLGLGEAVVDPNLAAPGRMTIIAGADALGLM